VARCPSCLSILSLTELRDHLLPCLTDKFQQFKTSGQIVQLKPIDATEYRDFSVTEVRDEIVVFFKLSNHQYVEVPLRAIRDITPSVNREPALITLRGAMRWREDIQRWRFATE